MKFDPQKGRKWLASTSVAVPGLSNILEKAESDTLVIGAGVFDVYHQQGWIPLFKRKTGDLDLSVGLVNGDQDYWAVYNAFLGQGYQKKPGHPEYRLFTPKEIPGALSYVDLLAHPAQPGITPAEARAVMRGGPELSFSGIEFATLHAHRVSTKTLCPNVLGFLALKRASYLDDPIRRIKDLADIVELGWGWVEKGMHFEMEELWQAVKHLPEAVNVIRMLTELANGESAKWDLENARQELLKRGFTAEDTEKILPARLKEWVENLS